MNIQIEEDEMTVKNYNGTTEKRGNDDVLATDLNLSVNKPVDFLGKFSESDKDWPKIWKSLLWNDKGEITGHGLKHIEFNQEFSGHRITVRDEEEKEMVFEDCKVKKFHAEPLPGFRIDLKFQIRLYPTKQQNGELSALQNRTTGVAIMGSPQGDMLQENKE